MITLLIESLYVIFLWLYRNRQKTYIYIYFMSHTFHARYVLQLQCSVWRFPMWSNKANLRDLMAATGLAILLKLHSNRRFFSPCDLEICSMTSKNIKAPLLCYTNLCASFQIHRWVQTGVTVRKRSIQIKIGDFFVPCEIWWMILKNNREPFLCYVKHSASFQSHRHIRS